MSESAASEPRHYELCALTGQPRMVLKFPAAGITLTGETIAWRTGDGETGKDLASVTGIHLSIGHLPRNSGMFGSSSTFGTFGTCVIGFRGGDAVTISSGNEWGAPDEERAETYAGFLHDLHRVVAARASGVRYRAGVTEGRHTGMKVITVLTGLLFVALPVVLAVVAQELEMLFITAAGAIFVYPLYLMTERNRPRDYAPHRIPPEILP